MVLGVKNSSALEAKNSWIWKGRCSLILVGMSKMTLVLEMGRDMMTLEVRELSMKALGR